MRQILSGSLANIYFQAAKFDSGSMSNWKHCRKTEQAESPLDSWSLGQSRAHELRHDWEAVKAHAMYMAVRAKYEQHPEHAVKLAETNDPISSSPSTSNWQRLNAIVLERVRYELQQRFDSKPQSRDYEKWCDITNLPATSKSIVVYLTSGELQPKTRPQETASTTYGGGERDLIPAVEVDADLI